MSDRKDTGMVFNPAAIAEANAKPAQAEAPRQVFNMAEALKSIAAEKESERIQVVSDTTPLGQLDKWSHSSLVSYEECAYREFLKGVKRIRQESGPAAERGTLIHGLAEDFVQGNISDLPPELLKIETRVREVAEAYARGEVEVEQEWGFDRAWNPGDWDMPGLWHRAKLDVFWRTSPTSGRIIDWKTGKRFNNELKHGQQGLTYTIDAFMRHPELEFVETEFAYVDHGEYAKSRYTRAQAMHFHPQLHNRAVMMTTATEFKPKPSFNACRWCYYAKSGDCDFVWTP